jgi:hypothetical protein
MEVLLMGFGDKNDRKSREVLASARARDCSETVVSPNSTAGAVNSRQLSPPDPPKPDGLVRISRKNLICEFSCVKNTSIYESTA